MRKFILLLVVSTILFIATACVYEMPAVLEIPPQIEEVTGDVDEVLQAEEVEEIEEAEPDIEETKIEEVLPEPLIIAKTPYISDFGRQVTEDFLAEFLSIFSFGWGPDSDALVRFYRVSPFVPPYFIYYDQMGNIIEDVSFLLGNAMVAFGFELFDLDHSGIPDIVVRFSVPDICASTRILYRFIDGKFVPSEPLEHFSFFRNEEGHIIALFNSMLGQSMVGYYYMVFDGLEIILEPIVTEVDDWAAWWSFHTYRQNADGAHILDIDTIFGTDIPIIHVPRMTELEAEITASIKERLGLTQ